MAGDVFISHASEDAGVTAQVCALLEGRGLRCWMAPRDVPGGAVWDEAILDAIEGSRVFLLILSGKANQSQFVKNEVNRAFSQNKPIVTFRLEEVAPGRSLELYLARHHWTDGFPPPLGARVDTLSGSLAALLNGAASQATPSAAVPSAATLVSATRPPLRARLLSPLRALTEGSRRLSGRTLAFGLGALLLGGIVSGISVWNLKPALPTAPETRTEIVTPSTIDPTSFALSPDGRQIAFVASGNGPSRLWVRRLDATTAQPLAGTEGASFPFWSPDSSSVAFVAGSTLKRLDLGGGSPSTLTNEVDNRRGSWGPDGTILFEAASTNALFRVSASGGEATAVTKLEKGTNFQRFPQFLPDGRQFIFYATGAPDKVGIYLGSLDSPSFKKITASDSNGEYLPTGWLLFVRTGTLFAQRLDLPRKAMVGDPIIIADSVAMEANSNEGAFSVSASGLLAYRPGAAGLHQLTWFDRAGKMLGTVGDPDPNGLSRPYLSPDGRRVAVFRTVQGKTDVWLVDARRDTRLTFDPSSNRSAVWSPDGSQIVFDSTRNGHRDLYLKPSNGLGNEQLLVSSEENKFASDWSRDGRFVLYGSTDPQTLFDIWVMPIKGARKPFVFLRTDFDERHAVFSPDERWVAYTSNQSGRYEVYVQPFNAGTPAAGGQWQVSTAGGMYPKWRSDGRELYYIAPDGKLMAVPIAVSGTALQPGSPVALFQTQIYGGGIDMNVGHQYDVSADGRFLINTVLEDAASPITLVQNWSPERKK